MTANAGSEGWVERYRRMGYRRFYEADSAEMKFGQHITIAYGEPDQEAPWLSAGYATFPSVSYDGEGMKISFTLEALGITHHFDFDVDAVEVLWKGL